MGQIVRRRKKGRPSKADLARRSGEPPSKPDRKETDVRRSLRRRNVKYNIDYDDYDDYFTEDDDEEEERRREKKVKLVEKLDQGRNGSARGSHAHESGGDEEEEGEEDDDDESERKPLKKRKINDGADSDKQDDESDGGGDDDDDCEERGRKPNSKLPTSPPGTPSDDPQTGIPLPDKKTLELILDKLQKKDTYGVYAEPVDPEELPDYHDVIKHPMDFATVRKQLADGSYSTLEQFEGDVFLICSNAMEYNSSDTIYYKQACSIQELAKKRFERLRIDYERSEKELKIVQKTNSNSLVKKQTKKPMCRTLQEPIGSDFSSGATLATAGDVQNSSHPTQGSGCEKPSNTEKPNIVERPSKIDVPVEGNSSLNEATTEKAEDMSSGKGLVSKAGRKSSVVDENRRGTYNICTQPVIRSESIFTTFDGEIKQFVAVGLHAEYSYARSLARFSGSLGPIAWKVASKRIEQALPDGCKFGRGWVGEYEPLPTPVLMVENCTQNQSAFSSKFYSGPERKGDRTLRTSVPFKEHPDTGPLTEERQHSVSIPTSGGRPSLFGSARGHYSEGKPSAVCSVGAKSGTTIPAKEDHSVTGTEERQHSVSIPTSGGRPSLFGSSRGRYSEGKSPVIGSVGAKPATGVPAEEHPVTGPVMEERLHSVSVPTSAGRSSLFGSSRGHHSEGKPPVIGSVGAKSGSAGAKSGSAGAKSGSAGAKSGSAVNSVHPRKNPKSRFVVPEKKVQKEVELNSVPSVNESNANLVAEKQLPRNSETAASRSRDTVSKNMHLQQPVPFKMPDSNGIATRGLPNGKSLSASLENQKIGPSVNASGQMDRTSAFFPHGQEQGLSDPVRLMKKLAEKTQKQPKSTNPSSMDTQPVVSSVPTISRDDSSNAAAAAARAWMSIGAGAFKQPSENLTKPNSQISADSLYNPAREFHSQISRLRGEFPMQFQSPNSFSLPSFLPQAVRMGNEGQFQNRPTIFPQLAGADLSRFQVQSAWQGFSPHAQPRPRQKQESLPPDLNIGFQSPGSPVKQSSGLMVDSQQPDLALQL